MNKRKNVIFYIFIIGIIGSLLFFLFIYRKGDILHVKRVIPKSEQYSKKDIEAAMDVVEYKFYKMFEGCNLTDLWYDEKLSLASAEGWNDEPDQKETMILLSNFKVDSAGGDGSLNPGDTYRNWQWILERDKGSRKWKLVTWGYG